ncbi:MAG: nitroreductase family protein, partial [Synergistaceae bacterium]|nr:nitroreductase family protein [Synergistaceae bacterium]
MAIFIHLTLNVGRKYKMDLMTIIKTRRSIRKYQNKQIPSKDLEKIIEAGLYAPNAGGR